MTWCRSLRRQSGKPRKTGLLWECCSHQDVTLPGLAAHLRGLFTTGAEKPTILSGTPALKMEAQQTFPSQTDSQATFVVWHSPTTQPRTANSPLPPTPYPLSCFFLFLFPQCTYCHSAYYIFLLNLVYCFLTQMV